MSRPGPGVMPRELPAVVVGAAKRDVLQEEFGRLRLAGAALPADEDGLV